MQLGAYVHCLLPAPVVFVYVFVPRPVPGELPPAAGAGPSPDRPGWRTPGFARDVLPGGQAG